MIYKLLNEAPSGPYKIEHKTTDGKTSSIEFNVDENGCFEANPPPDFPMYAYATRKPSSSKNG